jgi:PIN domain nuclease of toxin-antitoxin system
LWQDKTLKAKMDIGQLYEEVLMRSMVNTIREQVNYLRFAERPVAVKTIHLAFQTPEEDRTPLHRLIIREAGKLIEKVPQT